MNLLLFPLAITLEGEASQLPSRILSTSIRRAKQPEAPSTGLREFWEPSQFVVSARRPAQKYDISLSRRPQKHYDPNAPLPPDASPGSRCPQAREASATSSQSHDLAASMLPPMLPPAASESSSTAGLLPLHRPSLPHRHSGDAPNWQSQ